MNSLLLNLVTPLIQSPNKMHLLFSRYISKRRIENLLCFVVLSFFLTACDTEPQVEEKAGKVIVKPAILLTVGQDISDKFLNYPAVIQSTQSLTLAFQVGGVLKEVMVIEAESIKKGQILAKLDQRDYIAQLNSVEAQFKNAEAEYQRAERLIEEQAISRSLLEQRKSQFDVTRAQLDSAQKALDDTVLRSPFPGSVATVSIEVSQNVQPGEAAITVLGVGGLEASVNIPSYIVAQAKRNDEQKDAAYVILDADQNIRIPARFKSVALEADAASQTFQVNFAFESPENLIVLPGMNAMVWFRNPNRSQAGTKGISIPLTSITSDQNEKFVWVVDPDSMTVSKRLVVIQSGIGSHLNVLSGLQAGETIVAAGVSYLSEGLKVRAWSN